MSIKTHVLQDLQCRFYTCGGMGKNTLIGFGVCYWWNKPTVSQQQQISNDIYTIANYVRDKSTAPTTAPKAQKHKAKVVNNDDNQSDN